jgi:hypothetical protein
VARNSWAGLVNPSAGPIGHVVGAPPDPALRRRTRVSYVDEEWAGQGRNGATRRPEITTLGGIFRAPARNIHPDKLINHRKPVSTRWSAAGIYRSRRPMAK